MRSYKIGFSIKGAIALLLVMLPTIIYTIFPPDNNITLTHGYDSSNQIVNIIMKIIPYGMIAILILLRKRVSIHKPIDKFYIAVCIISLSAYYVLYAYYYYLGDILSIIVLGTDNNMVLGMAISPSIFLISYAIWQKHIIMLIPTIIFSVLHIVIACSNVIIS